MSFPNYKKAGWFSPNMVPDGWDDRGEVGSIYKVIKGQKFSFQDVCLYCDKPIHIGIENGRKFKFCLTCLQESIEAKSKN